MGYVHFDKRCFPVPGKEFHNLSWRLRYDPASITKQEKLYVSSVMNAYAYIIDNTNKDNAYIKRKIKEYIREKE